MEDTMKRGGGAAYLKRGVGCVYLKRGVCDLCRGTVVLIFVL